MFDAILSIVVQHYVIVGILVLTVGGLVNLAVTAAPEIAEHLRLNKLY